MQLNRLVNFHKVLGDETRIRILVLLKNGPLHGQAIAGKLGKTPPTITHHIAKLKEIAIIQQRREKNTIYYELNENVIRRQSHALLDMIFDSEKELTQMVQKEKQTIIENFLTKDGRLKTIPAQKKKKLYLLEYMVKGLEMGKKYPEKEINEHIKQFHEDYATIRREFIMNHFMYRKDGIYELNPQEMWATIQ